MADTERDPGADIKCIYLHLVECAIDKRTTTYGELAELVGLPGRGNHMASVLARYLAQILEWAQRRGHPTITALVVKTGEGPQSGIPGNGFWNILNLTDTALHDRRHLTRCYQDIVFAYYNRLLGD